MADRTFPVRDPRAMLLHPDYHAKAKQGQDLLRILPDKCIREGHTERAMGHLVSRAVLRLIADPAGEVIVLGTGYKEMEDGKDYLSAAGAWPFHLNQATAFPGTCNSCEQNFVSADNIGHPGLGVDLHRALFEACARSTHHAIWIAELFNNTLRAYDAMQADHPIKGIADISELEQANERIAELARECLPPLPLDVIPAGTPLEHDEHFRHFIRIYYDTKFKVAVSTEVVLQHNNDPATRTLAFINVVPQDAGRHTAAALSLPGTAPSIWQDILDNSEHSGNFGELAHQLLVSNLGTRSPDYAVSHGQLRGWRGQRRRSADLPLFPPGSKVARPVVNVTGHDLSSLTSRSFNLFA